mgnify:CR=1 FL=1
MNLLSLVSLWPPFGLGVVYLPIVHYHVLEGPSAESHLLIGP